MTPAQILALIEEYIIANGVGSITAPVLANILSDICNLFLAASGQVARIVNLSVGFTMLATDYRVGLYRTVNPAALAIQLIPIPIGAEVVIQDLAGNMSAYPVTVYPPAGTAFSGPAGGRTQYIMNEDNQTARFAYYGANIWGVEPA